MYIFNLFHILFSLVFIDLHFPASGSVAAFFDTCPVFWSKCIESVVKQSTLLFGRKEFEQMMNQVDREAIRAQSQAP